MLTGSKVSREWLSVVEDLRVGDVVFVLGASDTGKTTLIKFVINECIKKGKRIAFVDSDVGQTSIGLPTTISSSVFSSIEDLKSPKINSLFFIGSTSPHGNLLQMAVGVKKTTESVLRQKPDVVVIDTTGFVHGPAATELKYQKISLVQPSCVIAIQREAELEPLLRLLSNSFEGLRIIRLNPSPDVRARSFEERLANRERRFASYFSRSSILKIDLGNVSLRRGYFGGGLPISSSRLYEISKIFGADFLYGEEGKDEALFIVRSAGYIPALVSKVQGFIQKSSIRIVPLGDLEGVIVGLGNKGGFVLGLGIFSSMEEGTISILTPLKDVSRVKTITFGTLKLEPSGKEVGKLSY
jgi:polynucleotide 5'-hydroxyl-kinase GRC3/NOL9